MDPMPHPIRVARTPEGALAYAIPVPPEELPAVLPRQLLAAWELARAAAGRREWGKPRVLLFPRPDGAATELALADRDAGAWAEAIDSAIGLDTLDGLSLCLRLLALVEVLGRARSLAAHFAVTPAGIELHPSLVSAAAALPLDGAARFDE
ncbi:MAG: hypothetical protein JWP04_1344, partial [Belnapia sp.]|nr:hypothetical protein [Belnapia sp.]